MNLRPYIAALPLLLVIGGCSSDTEGGNGGDPDASTQVAPDAELGAEVDASPIPVDLFPNGLECPTMSLCTTYTADPSRVPFPEEVGGSLKDGLYRPVQGTSLAYGLAISNGKWARMMPNLTVQYGDIEVIAADRILMTRHTVCANGILDDDAFVLEQEYSFAVDGDELITYSGCGSADPNQCGSPVRLLRVNSLCDDLDSLECEGGSCNCATFSETIPQRPEGDTCQF